MEIKEEYQEIIDMLLAYKKSAPGIIYGTIEIKGSSIDEYMFDELLKINVDGLDTNFKLRQEIKKIEDGIKLGYNFVLMCAEKDPIEIKKEAPSIKNKDVKLSDLMRRAN